MLEQSEQADSFAQKEEAMPSSSLFSLPTEIIELILDPSLVIERVRRDLKGQILQVSYKKDANGNTYPISEWKKIGARVMNDKGVEMVVSILNKYVNRNSVFTQLEEEEIYKITRTLAKNLNALFYAKGEEFEIDVNYKSIIADGVTDMCFFAMKQSQNKALMEALTKFWSVKELKGDGWKQKQAFSLGDLNPFKGGGKNG
jgi:hypothetical protein